MLPAKEGGCIVGGGKSATLYHYSVDGLLVGAVAPGAPMGRQSGWYDNQASVAVHQAPRDTGIDIFTEDNFVGRIGWYRLSAGGLKTFTGPLANPFATSAESP